MFFKEKNCIEVRHHIHSLIVYFYILIPQTYCVSNLFKVKRKIVFKINPILGGKV